LPIIALLLPGKMNYFFLLGVSCFPHLCHPSEGGVEALEMAAQSHLRPMATSTSTEALSRSLHLAIGPLRAASGVIVAPRTHLNTWSSSPGLGLASCGIEWEPIDGEERKE
jgi:hypothetical protein